MIQETEEGIADDSEQIQSKRQRADYSIFKTDVARLQKNLEEFEVDLKQHPMQVQQKLAFILSVLDEGGTPGMATALPALGLSEEDVSSPDQPAGDDNSNSTVSEALEAEQLAVEMTSWSWWAVGRRRVMNLWSYAIIATHLPKSIALIKCS